MSNYTSYRFHKIDFSDHDWFSLLEDIEDYPIYDEMFDCKGEMDEEYSDSFNVDYYDIDHDSIRIKNLRTLIRFLMDNMDNGQITKEMVSEILLMALSIDEANARWVFKGDLDEEGFSLCIYDEKTDEIDITIPYRFINYP